MLVFQLACILGGIVAKAKENFAKKEQETNSISFLFYCRISDKISYQVLSIILKEKIL